MYSSGLENTGMYDASQEDDIRLVAEYAERNERRGFRARYAGEYEQPDPETQRLWDNADASLQQFRETAWDVRYAWNARNQAALDLQDHPRSRTRRENYDQADREYNEAGRVHDRASLRWITDGWNFHQAVEQALDVRDRDIRQTLTDPNANDRIRQWATTQWASIPDPNERAAVYSQPTAQQFAVSQQFTPQQQISPALAGYRAALTELANENEAALQRELQRESAAGADAPQPFADVGSASPMQVDGNPLAAYMASIGRRRAEVAAELAQLPPAPTNVARTLTSQREATPSAPPQERERRNARDPRDGERHHRRNRDRRDNNGSSQNGSRRSRRS
ncbi:hypothetical protein [Streptomyces axinellae]